MKQYLAFLIFAGLSSCIDAQTVKETVRGKYGEDLGTAETTVRGGKRVTVYRDKYGQLLEHQKVRPTLLARLLRFTRISMVKKQAPAPVQQVMDCSLPERLLPLIVISMARKQVLASPNIQEIQVPPSIEISMGRLLARALLRAGYQTKVPIIMDGAVQSQGGNDFSTLRSFLRL